LIDVRSGRDDIQELAVPVVEIARDLGNAKAANIVALAAFVSKSGIVALDELKRSVEAEFAEKAKLIPLNMKAITAGVKAAADA